MNGKFAAFAAMGMLLAGQAHAADAAVAQMGAVTGSVVVSQNGKFVQASSATALKAGDRVVAKGGQTSVKFADGCQVTLKPQAMITVGAVSPCASGAGLVSAAQGSSAQGEGTAGFLPAAAAFGVLALVVVAVGQSGDDNTVSP